MRAFFARHLKAISSVVLVGIVLGVGAMLWFQPWKLFTNNTVEEALPTPTTSVAVRQPVTLSSGAFRSLEHHTTGRAKIILLADGRRIVRLEGFRTSQGPDVVVLLSSTTSTSDSWGSYDDRAHVNLGSLKGNIGDQNYEIPDGVTLGTYRSVVIWCRRFTVGFGAAPIVLV